VTVDTPTEFGFFGTGVTISDGHLAAVSPRENGCDGNDYTYCSWVYMWSLSGEDITPTGRVKPPANMKVPYSGSNAPYYDLALRGPPITLHGASDSGVILIASPLSDYRQSNPSKIVERAGSVVLVAPPDVHAFQFTPNRIVADLGYGVAVARSGDTVVIGAIKGYAELWKISAPTDGAAVSAERVNVLVPAEGTVASLEVAIQGSLIAVRDNSARVAFMKRAADLKLEKAACRLHALEALALNAEGKLELQCEVCAKKGADDSQLNLGEAQTQCTDEQESRNILEERKDVEVNGSVLEGEDTMASMIQEWEAQPTGLTVSRDGTVVVGDQKAKFEFIKKIKDVEEHGVYKGQLLKSMFCAVVQGRWKCCVSKALHEAQGLSAEEKTKLKKELKVW